MGEIPSRSVAIVIVVVFFVVFLKDPMHGLGLEKELSVLSCSLLLLNHHPPGTPGQYLTTSYFHPTKLAWTKNCRSIAISVPGQYLTTSYFHPSKLAWTKNCR